jgi:hypothetical protein
MAVKYRSLPQSKWHFHGNSVSILNTYDYSRTDACDVVNYEEYEAVVNKILEKRPTRAVTVFVDMKDVKKSIKVCIRKPASASISNIDFAIQKDGSADTEDGSDDDDEVDVSIVTNITYIQSNFSA